MSRGVCERPVAVYFRRAKNPCPVSDTSSSTLRGWFYRCEYGSSFLLRGGFSNIKSRLNSSELLTDVVSNFAYSVLACLRMGSCCATRC